MKGYQCLKNLYLTIHNADEEPAISPEQQARFDEGSKVGEEARKRFPGGVLVDNAPWDFIGSLKRTRELLKAETHVIFEAAFEYKGLYSRADVMAFSKESGRWTIYEVKSSTKVKPEQIEDIRLQTFIMVNNGLPIEKICILHLNPECVYPNLEKLFIEADVTDRVRDGYTSLPAKLNEIFAAIKAETVPDIDIGPQCSEPYDCNWKDRCFKEKKIPEISIFNLPRIFDRQWQLYKQGIVGLTDPRLTELTLLQERVVEAFKTGERYLNKEGIQSSLKEWKYPYVFLDFETINPAIPRYAGTRPYAQTPFQFSVHVWHEGKSELEHYEYLHLVQTDPREALIESLLKACGTEGSIIAYFGKFEAERIQELSEFSPRHKEALLKLVDRIVDPLPIFREHVYDNEFKGSFSLKNVGPALLGKSFSYKDMIVGDGGACQRAWEEMINAQTSASRKDELKQGILEYCKKDTFVMVELVKWMQENN